MMRAFEYASPKSTQQAVGLLGKSWTQAQILAGGTDLLGLMKDDIVSPKRVVNIKDVGGLDRIGLADAVVIGALSRLSDIADNALIRKKYPMLAYAIDEAASPQIRNMATIGGNLCQRPRCWYFRSGFGLLAMKDGKSMVAAGDNRNHAIIGNDGPAKFVSPSTMAPALIAYDASVTIVGPKGTRNVPLAKFYRIPKAEGEREHDLQPDEIITEIVLPAGVFPSQPPVHAAQYEVRQKAAFDWPLSLASVALWLDGKTVKKATIVLGAVAPVPWVSEEASAELVGKELNEQTADAAAAAAVSIAKPLSKNTYKVQLTRVAVKRALLKAAAEEGARA
jgi:xanthine dehydrogenase YagS FAD-binding subunit